MALTPYNLSAYLIAWEELGRVFLTSGDTFEGEIVTRTTPGPSNLNQLSTLKGGFGNYWR